ncbi:helix-turn-helix transcriptional regulator [Winogradskyella alexanderae]|uniref:Helix-turn-helix domain-containing protein n=1 Tax=Winogradskyella alexanderae TaxID=2877123 RepID=A0ABS7XPQ6_9FLAO|nr:helix-turn-helix domain-containing protein [Winogradskyella alexanderae]MCA0131760.1 helix-turn-helix domain-containing protein [Winogradskyella alexanderae]
MSDLSKPLYSLTVGEYIDLSKEAFAQEAKKLLNSTDGTSGHLKSNSDIIFVDDVQQLTGYKKSTIYSKVCRFEMPVISKRRPLTFSRTDIMNWLKDGKPSIIDIEANDYLSKT